MRITPVNQNYVTPSKTTKTNNSNPAFGINVNVDEAVWNALGNNRHLLEEALPVIEKIENPGTLYFSSFNRGSIAAWAKDATDRSSVSIELSSNCFRAAQDFIDFSIARIKDLKN